MIIPFVKYGWGYEKDFGRCFLSIHKYWQGVYYHGKHWTFRFYLFGFDKRHRDDRFTGVTD